MQRSLGSRHLIIKRVPRPLGRERSRRSDFLVEKKHSQKQNRPENWKCPNTLGHARQWANIGLKKIWDYKWQYFDLCNWSQLLLSRHLTEITRKWQFCEDEVTIVWASALNLICNYFNGTTWKLLVNMKHPPAVRINQKELRLVLSSSLAMSISTSIHHNL